MRVLKFNEPKLCSLHELRTVYTLNDLYGFVEIIEVHNALMEQAQSENEAKHRESMDKNRGQR